MGHNDLTLAKWLKLISKISVGGVQLGKLENQQSIG